MRQVIAIAFAVLVLIGGCVFFLNKGVRSVQADETGVHPAVVHRQKMPVEYLILRVQDLDIGQSGWTSVHSVVVTRERDAALLPSAEVHLQKESIYKLKITRLQQGFEVNVSEVPRDERGKTASDTLLDWPRIVSWVGTD